MNMTDKHLTHEACKDYGDEYEPKPLSKLKLAAIAVLVMAAMMACSALFGLV